MLKPARHMMETQCSALRLWLGLLAAAPLSKYQMYWFLHMQDLVSLFIPITNEIHGNKELHNCMILSV